MRRVPFEGDGEVADDHCEECHEELRQATDAADELRRSLNDCQREADRKQQEYDEKIAELQRQLRDALTRTPAGRFDELREELNEAKREAAQHKAAVERLKVEISRLTAELEKCKSEQPVEYLAASVDDGLRRMREAMKRVSERYPQARAWVKIIEDTYTLILSGEMGHA